MYIAYILIIVCCLLSPFIDSMFRTKRGEECFVFTLTPLLMIDKKGEMNLSLYACFYDYACFCWYQVLVSRVFCFKNIVWLVLIFYLVSRACFSLIFYWYQEHVLIDIKSLFYLCMLMHFMFSIKNMFRTFHLFYACLCIFHV